MKINLATFLTKLSEIGNVGKGSDFLNLNFSHVASVTDVVVVPINSVDNPSDEDINLIYGISLLNETTAVLILTRIDDNSILGAIFPEDLSDFRVTYESPETTIKDLGSGLPNKIVVVPLVIYRCKTNDQHPKYACHQKGAKVPEHCFVCQNKLVKVV